MTTTTEAPYAIGRTVPLPYPEALERIRAALAKEGFGVLTEIDVQATLKKKLDVDFRRYIILGACNPPLSYRGFQAEPDIGLLLPCNVIVYEEGPVASRVAVLNPVAQLGLTGRADIAPLATEAKTRLERALATLPGA